LNERFYGYVNDLLSIIGIDHGPEPMVKAKDKVD
jgi:hypothetical protein